MRFSIVPVVLAPLFATQALGFLLNFTVPGIPVNVTIDKYLPTSDTTLTSRCAPSCGPAQAAISACGEDSSCVCKLLKDDKNVTLPTSVPVQIQTCQQCYFSEIVKANIPYPDPRTGTLAALSAFATSCNTTAGIVYAKEEKIPALALPTDFNWNGPFGLGVNLPTTAITVIIGGVLGVGLITVVNTM